MNRLMVEKTQPGKCAGLARSKSGTGFASLQVVWAQVIGYNEDNSTKYTKKREAMYLRMTVCAMMFEKSFTLKCVGFVGQSSSDIRNWIRL